MVLVGTTNGTFSTREMYDIIMEAVSKEDALIDGIKFYSWK